MISQIFTLCLIFAVMSIQKISAQEHNASSLFCYQCNSAVGMDGPSCDSSNVNDLAKHLKVCPADGKEYTRCRKMNQNVEDKSRIIRSCATAGVSDGHGDRCVDRVGTARVKIQYCECHNNSPNTPCNSAHQNISPPTVMAFLLLLLVSAFISRLWFANVEDITQVTWQSF